MLSGTTILITAVGVFVIGAIFLRRGIWPRRVGDTPYCGRCNYNLTAMERERCPECGCDISPETIVRGQRRRRPGFIVAGAACMLPLLFVAGLSIAKVDWYRYKPTGWVIADLNTTNTVDWQRSWNELDRRIIRRELSREHESRLIDLCLVEQSKQGPTSGRMENCVDYLGDTYLRDMMSEEQAKTFFDQIVQIELQVRERVIAGDDVPYLIIEHSRCPSPPWLVNINNGRPWIDDQRVRPVRLSNEDGIQLSGVGASGYSSGKLTQPLEPGAHTLKVRPLMAVRTESTHSAADTIHHEREFSLESAFEVLATEPLDYITMVNDPDLHDQLLDCFEPRNFRVNYSPVHRVLGEIAATVMPINVAFDVIARVRGDELVIGTIVSNKGEKPPMWHLRPFWRVDNPPIDSFDLILRSNEELVRNSVDMYEAWEGELVYEDVPVSSNSAP